MSDKIKVLDDYKRLAASLETIAKIENSAQWDKKELCSYNSPISYSSDFGVLHLAYWAGTYGDSSTSNKLPTLSEDAKKEFNKFLNSRMHKLLKDFCEYLKQIAEKEARSRLEKIEVEKDYLNSILK